MIFFGIWASFYHLRRTSSNSGDHPRVPATISGDSLHFFRPSYFLVGLSSINFSKMPPKRTKVSGGSSSALSTVVAGKFVNETAGVRFEMAKSTRHPISERGFCLASRGHSVTNMIRNRGWGKFCQQPTAAATLIVREFYANAVEFEDGKSWVRGKAIQYDSVTLNGLFDLAPVDDSVFQGLMNDPDYDLVLDTLCAPGSTWIRPGVYCHFLEKFLTVDAAVWYGFLTRRMMHVSHTTDVQKERAVVLYALTTGVPIDVGKLLYSQIMLSIHNGHVGLFFPHIITRLCTLAGVGIGMDDEYLQPMKAIDDAYVVAKGTIRTARRTTSTVGESSSGPSQTHTTVPPTTSTYRPPPPQPRRRNLRDRIDEIGAFAMHQNNYNAVNSAHMQYLESMMQGMAMHMGMDPSMYPPPPPYPPSFTFPYSYPGSEEVGGMPPPEMEEEDAP